jgi:hypothetical protein
MMTTPKSGRRDGKQTPLQARGGGGMRNGDCTTPTSSFVDKKPLLPQTPEELLVDIDAPPCLADESFSALTDQIQKLQVLTLASFQ